MIKFFSFIQSFARTLEKLKTREFDLRLQWDCGLIENKSIDRSEIGIFIGLTKYEKSVTAFDAIAT